MAEGIFKQLVLDKKLENKIYTDSAGTSAYHLGDNPDARMQETALHHGITLRHKARQFTEYDFDKFDFIIAMDSSNYEDICSLEYSENGSYKVLMMRDFDTNSDDKDVPDPYYGGSNGFEEVYSMLLKCCTNFLNHIISQHKLNG